MRINRRLQALFAAATLLVAPVSARAWSNQGHMVTGALAHDDLAATDAGLIAKVEALMAAHPDKARFDKGLEGYTGEARARRLFELMARWPDDIRGGLYDHPGWHYWLRLVESTADPIHLPPALLATTTGEAREAYAVNLAMARDAYIAPGERAVALCWLFHLAGDIQQPLHAGTLVSKRFPLSDRAGQSDWVRDGGAAINLHEYWDNAVGGDADDDANVEATRLRLGKAWPRSALPELTRAAGPDAFGAWADESYHLAQTTAYDGGRFEGAAKAEAAEAPSPSYAAARRDLGERRVAMAGHRIADAVRAALGPGGR